MKLVDMGIEGELDIAVSERIINETLLGLGEKFNVSVVTCGELRRQCGHALAW